MRVAVVGHVEWVDFVPVPRLPQAGQIVHGHMITGREPTAEDMEPLSWALYQLCNKMSAIEATAAKAMLLRGLPMTRLRAHTKGGRRGVRRPLLYCPVLRNGDHPDAAAMLRRWRPALS